MTALMNACVVLANEDIQGFVRYFQEACGVTAEQVTLARRGQDLAQLQAAVTRGLKFVEAVREAWVPLPEPKPASKWAAVLRVRPLHWVRRPRKRLCL